MMFNATWSDLLENIQELPETRLSSSPSPVMRRRTFLTVIVSGASLSGCLSQTDEGPARATTSSPTNGTATPVRQTADGITATFQVVDGHAPTDDTASASFEETHVTVTGTMDPSGCNRPMLSSVRYNAADSVIHLRIGGESPDGQTGDVECGNASFDYRSVLSVDSGRPTTVEVVHDYEDKTGQSFTLERE
jgi:hypothetical protein